MCFCETNRIHFDEKTEDKMLRWNWMRRKCVEISIRFVFRELAIHHEAIRLR